MSSLRTVRMAPPGVVSGAHDPPAIKRVSRSTKELQGRFAIDGLEPAAGVRDNDGRRSNEVWAGTDPAVAGPRQPIMGERGASTRAGYRAHPAGSSWVTPPCGSRRE